MYWGQTLTIVRDPYLILRDLDFDLRDLDPAPPDPHAHCTLHGEPLVCVALGSGWGWRGWSLRTRGGHGVPLGSGSADSSLARPTRSRRGSRTSGSPCSTQYNTQYHAKQTQHHVKQTQYHANQTRDLAN